MPREARMLEVIVFDDLLNVTHVRLIGMSEYGDECYRRDRILAEEGDAAPIGEEIRKVVTEWLTGQRRPR